MLRLKVFVVHQKFESEQNKRKHDRIKTKLLGRYMLADRREAKCTIIDVSLGGLALTAPETGTIGETVILYVDHIGRVEGTIVRFLENGFAIKLAASTHATEKLARELKELQANRGLSRVQERRQEPRIRVDDEMIFPSRPEAAECEVIDLSLTGADVKLAGPRPPIGAVVQVGRLRGKVIRHSEAGIAIEFVEVPDIVTLTDRLSEIALIHGVVLQEQDSIHTAS